MNDTKNKEKTIQLDFNKSELITLLQKVQGDYQMLDWKIEELLNSEDIDVKSMGGDVKRLQEAYRELNDLAKSRNKKLQELLKSINN